MTASLGLVCLVLGTVLGLPQAIKIIRSGSTAGLSLLSWQIWLSVAIAWFGHGLAIASLTQTVPNAVSGLTSLLILRLVRRERGLRWLSVLWPVAALTGAALAVRFGLGPLQFGVFMAIPAAIAVVGQWLDLVRCRRLDGVSPVYLVGLTVLQGTWVVYGRRLPDVAAATTAVVIVTLASVNVGWYLARRVGLPALWPAADDDATDALVAR